MSDFRVGDFVRARIDRKDEDFYADVHPGDVGTVVVADDGDSSIGVDWGHNVNGHDCDVDIPDGNGTFVACYDLELLPVIEDEMDIPSPDLEGVL